MFRATSFWSWSDGGTPPPPSGGGISIGDGISPYSHLKRTPSAGGLGGTGISYMITLFIGLFA